MQGKRLQVLDDDAAVAVHDALRQAGGAGGVQHPQRVVERNGVKIQLARARRSAPTTAVCRPTEHRRPGTAAGLC